MALLSALPSALCAPDEKPKNTNVRGHIDSFNIMVVGRYLNSIEDLCNLSIVNKKYEDILPTYRYNPVGINSREQLALFPNIETCHVGKCEEDFILTFPNDDIKTLVYLPGSFNLSQFGDVLIKNKVVNSEGKCINNWERTFELNGENPKDGCQITFTDGEKTIVFMYSPCANGVLIGPLSYNAFLRKCRLDEKELAAASVTIPDVVSIPSFVKSIGEHAFANQMSLTKVNIPDSVTSIGDRAFAWCKSLTDINIPNSVTSIGNESFYECEGLTDINIPNSVTSIGEGAFRHCNGLTNVIIPNSVTSIGAMAFNWCNNLSSVVIPESVTSIGRGAFWWCGNLKEINIPNSVKSIEEFSFFGCKSLANIAIPESVTSIGNGAFYACSNLREISIPNSVTSIGDCVFDECTNLKHIEFNGKVYDNRYSFMEAFDEYIVSQEE